MAPAKPATNDVHPVRNAATPPKPSRRYTYSPPERGRSVASSAYATAPASASSPPATHTPMIHIGCGTAEAMTPGVMKMPTPMTLAMTIAAASTGPRRGSRLLDGEDDGGTRALYSGMGAASGLIRRAAGRQWA